MTVEKEGEEEQKEKNTAKKDSSWSGGVCKQTGFKDKWVGKILKCGYH